MLSCGLISYNDLMKVTLPPPNRQPLTSVTTSEESQILEVTGVQKLYLLIQVDLAGRAVLELADVPTSSDPKARGLVSTAAHTALLDGLCSDSACFIYSLYTLMFVTQEGFSNYKLLPHFATGTPNTLDLICQSSSRNLPGAEHLFCQNSTFWPQFFCCVQHHVFYKV